MLYRIPDTLPNSDIDDVYLKMQMNGSLREGLYSSAFAAAVKLWWLAVARWEICVRYLGINDVTTRDQRNSYCTRFGQKDVIRTLCLAHGFSPKTLSDLNDRACHEVWLSFPFHARNLLAAEHEHFRKVVERYEPKPTQSIELK